MPNTTTPANTPTPAPDLQARVEALELLLQQLVTVLDAEPRFTAAALKEWSSLCAQRMQETQSASAQTVQALRELNELAAG